MADKARKLTDQELKKLEREIYELYATSAADLSEKWRSYMSSHKKKLNALHDELEKAKASGNRNDIKAARDEYERAVKNVTLNDNRYKAMINETTAKMAHVNEIALNYANDEMPKIYTLNYNAFADEKIDGYTFTLVNERAVKNLFESDKIELPPKKLDIQKDKAWNAKNINSQLMQGILQGESISKIAARLQNVTDMNRNSAIRNARTMVTGAENKGRQDSFKKATDDGVLLEREWIATHDGRTRAWHKELHGMTVGVDEPWVNDYGEIMYPGDPDADPCNVYNCRCSIRAIVKGFAWNQEKSEVEDEYEDTHNVAQGKDISSTWERRPDKFDFEIEDVINAQGFDGLPRVVSADEFDKYVEESKFIAQRVYSAPDQETLKAYQDQLYTGKWYVDCSVGTGAYGQGMYSSADWDGALSDATKNSMDFYKMINESEGRQFSAIETFTLAKDAKVIDYENAYDEYLNYKKDNKDVTNFGTYATLKGYDVIRTNKGVRGSKEAIILNRTKCIFRKE